MKTKILSIILCLCGFTLHVSANEKIYVNCEVTTHIVMPENIKLVDISTTKIIGNQCADNIVRIKPFIESDSINLGNYKEDELLGTVTLIGERHIAQYDIIYTGSANMPLLFIMCPTNMRNLISTPKFPCRYRKWHTTLGRSMAASASTTRWYQGCTA